jgi:hypothetical protein
MDIAIMHWIYVAASAIFSLAAGIDPRTYRNGSNSDWEGL